jgi:hypothetical protein
MRVAAWIAWILVPGMLACSPAADDDSWEPDPDPDDPAEGYQETDVGVGMPIVSVSATVSDAISTVVTVDWESEEASSGFVLFADDADDEVRTLSSSGSGTEHQIYLKGLRSQTTVRYRVCIDTELQGWCSSERTVETGSLPPELPVMELSAHDPAQASGGYTVFSLIGEHGSVPVIVDAEGHYVWYHVDEEREPSTRAVLSLDRGSVLISRGALFIDLPGAIYRIAYDGSQVEEIEAVGIGLDFTEVEPGRFAYLSGEVREFDGDRRILGGTLVELQEGGDPRTVWSVFDDFTPNLDQEFPTFTPGEGVEPVEEWTHFNGISYDERTDAYLLTNTSPELEMVVCIDRASGELRWVLGSPQGDFAEGAQAPLIEAPHSAQLLDDGVLVFNRGNFANGCSRASEIELDMDSWSATLVWEYGSEECVSNYMLGHAERLDGGNTMTTFTTAGQIDEATPEGELVWRVRADVGTGFGFGGRVDALY